MKLLLANLLLIMNRISGLFVVVLVCILQCSESRETRQEGPFEWGVAKGVLDNKKIDEASGLAASRVNPGMFWTHNDSGKRGEIFLIDSLSSHKATFTLEGIVNRDWEDIAVGPGPDSTKSYIYVGEIGDNHSRYEFKYIYRLEEPVFSENESGLLIKDVDSIKFSLPGGPRDIEALMVDPSSKDLYLFSKRERSINLYRLPYPQPTTETFVGERVIKDLPFSDIVAADWSQDGSEILIKDYGNVYYWKIEKGKSIIETLQSKPEILAYEREPQGESICFDITGKGYYTLSEEVKGIKPELLFYKRK